MYKTSKINFITRWKIQLDSRDSMIRTVALSEISDMLNSLSEEKKDEIYILLINSDICHFISETISYRDKTAMRFINKIVGHLSESDDFFKNDFFKIFKSYLRVVNTFPEKADDNEKYQKDVFECMNFILTR
jgi:uncharacterized protein (UPF0216 family)